jgi:hypothetical protein
MSSVKWCSAVLGWLLLLALPLIAQQNPATMAPGRNPGARMNRHLDMKEGPCWRKTGASESVLQQRHTLWQNARQQERQICENSSLSEQQKRQQIHQLRSQTHQQVMALLSPQQQQELKQCRANLAQERKEDHPGRMAGMRRGHADPCARIMGGKENREDHEEE